MKDDVIKRLLSEEKRIFENYKYDYNIKIVEVLGNIVDKIFLKLEKIF